MHLFRLPDRRGLLPHTLFCGGIVDQFQEERQVRVRSSGHEREISAAESRPREVSIVQRGGEEIDFGLLRCGRGAAAKPIIFTVKSGELEWQSWDWGAANPVAACFRLCCRQTETAGNSQSERLRNNWRSHPRILCQRAVRSIGTRSFMCSFPMFRCKRFTTW